MVKVVTVKKKKKTANSLVRGKKISIDGLDFDSRLESFAYKELKSAGLYGSDKLTYESKQFTIVDSFIFDDKKYQGIKVTPDFVDEENKVIFEIKGASKKFLKADWVMRWKLMKKYFTDNNLQYKVFVAHSNQSNIKAEIEKIKKLYKDKNV